MRDADGDYLENCIPALIVRSFVAISLTSANGHSRSSGAYHRSACNCNAFGRRNYVTGRTNGSTWMSCLRSGDRSANIEVSGSVQGHWRGSSVFQLRVHGNMRGPRKDAWRQPLYVSGYFGKPIVTLGVTVPGYSRWDPRADGAICNGRSADPLETGGVRRRWTMAGRC